MIGLGGDGFAAARGHSVQEAKRRSKILWLLPLLMALQSATAHTGWAAAPTGFLDAGAFTCDDGLPGWACDADDYNRPLIVQFWEGASLRGEVVADSFRENGVGTACGGLSAPNGIHHRRHGFWWSIPETLRNGAPRTLSVRAVDPQNGSFTVIGGTTITCSPSSLTAGFWDPNIRNGKTRSDFDDVACPGGPPLDFSSLECAFLPRGGAEAQYAPPDTDNMNERSNYENCQSPNSSCDQTATGNSFFATPCAKNASSTYPSCNTFVDPPGWVEEDFWVLDVNSEPAAFPYGPYVPSNWNCVNNPSSKLGPPNKSLPVGAQNSNEQLALWRTFSSCSNNYTIHMRVDLTKTHPCENTESIGFIDFIPFFGWGADMGRGNTDENGEPLPLAVFRYPPDNVTRRKVIEFTHGMVASHTRITNPPTNDIHRARLLLGSYWNGKRRWLFIELGGVEDLDHIPLSTSANWNWISEDSRMWPGASIGFEPKGAGNVPLVEFIQATTTNQSRVLTLNIEDIFATAIDTFMWADQRYPLEPSIGRYMVGDKPTPGTILYLTDMMIAIESGKRDIGTHSSLTQTIRSLHTEDQP